MNGSIKELASIQSTLNKQKDKFSGGSFRTMQTTHFPRNEEIEEKSIKLS